MKLHISNMEQADKYIRGDLKQDEIEALWIHFLKDPDLYRYFITQLQVNHLIKEVNAGRVESPYAK